MANQAKEKYKKKNTKEKDILDLDNEIIIGIKTLPNDNIKSKKKVTSNKKKKNNKKAKSKPKKTKKTTRNRQKEKKDYNKNYKMDNPCSINNWRNYILFIVTIF